MYSLKFEGKWGWHSGKINTDQFASNYFLTAVLEKSIWVTKIANSSGGSLHITVKIKRWSKKERASGLSHVNAREWYTEKEFNPITLFSP